MKYGSGKPIFISVIKDGAIARLIVKDCGIGVSSQDRDRIFERFERAAPDWIKGLGLGLYIVKQIITHHGGTIRVESELGHGSSFIAELPIVRHGVQ